MQKTSNRFAEWCEKHLSSRQYVMMLSFFAGILSALAAWALKSLIELIQHFLTSEFDVTKSNWLFLIYPIIGIALSALFIKYIVRDDISHGVTKILHAISRRQGHLKRHNTWSSLIASALTIGFGGSVGAESPIALTGSAIGSNLGSAFKMDHKTTMLLVGCGASGAVAAIFKAPIAGLVFTLEVLMVDLTMASLLPLLVSCLTATCVTYALSGSLTTGTMFTFEAHLDFEMIDLVSIILLGIFCGLISLYFTRMMNWFEQKFAKLKNMYLRIAVGGCLLSVMIYFFPSLYGEGYNTIGLLLQGEADKVLNNSFLYGHSEYLLLYLGMILLLKVFASTATNGGGGCGGTFAPSLFLGCIGGFFFASLWNKYNILDAPTPVTYYALLGMSGVMSGVFHAPLTGVFLIAELTGGYELFIPLMIVSVASYLTIISFEPHSIYAMRLARKGQLITHNKDNSILTLMSLDAVIDKTAPRLTPDMPMQQMVQVISRSTEYMFAVTDRAGTLHGIININNLRHLMYRSELYRQYIVEQLMEQPVAVLHTDTTVANVMDTFDDTGATKLPVVNAENNFVGFISKNNLYASYRKLMKDFSEE
ncbi:chloride channel protein [Pseudoprevotella muciniphila]|nr:chloride channel protein [Pseudoprevotella muciniphila]